MSHFARLAFVLGFSLCSCTPGRVGNDMPTDGDTPDGGGTLVCSTVSDCPAGSDCVGGVCAAIACIGHGDCAVGQECVAGVCMGGDCEAADGCSADMACVAGSCTSVACATPSDCPFEHACLDGFCGASPESVTGSDPRRTTPFDGPDSARIVGMITELDGTPLAGATVTLDATEETAVSGTDGTFSLRGVGAGDHVIHFRISSHTSAHRSVTAAAWETITINEALLRRVSPVRINPGFVNTVGGSDGSATLPANGLVDADGMPVTGGVNVSVTPVDPTTDAIDGAPGDYVGEQDGMPAPLVSYGMIDLTVTDDAGNPVDLAMGQSIEVVVPAPDLPDRPLVEGDSVPTWIYDDTVPGWIQDGTATAEMRDGQLMLVGTVNQTNIQWNCDDPEVPVCFTGRVVDCAGYPIPGAEVQLRGNGVTSVTTSRTQEDGNYEVTGTARNGAIIRASIRIGNLSYFVDSEVVMQEADSCAAVPDLTFADLRYTSGRVDLQQTQSNSWNGTEDESFDITSGSAFLFDITDPGAGTGPFAQCATVPDDNLQMVSGDLPSGPPTTDIALLDVGNPIVVQQGANSMDVVRQYAGDSEEPDRYTSQPNVPFDNESGNYTVDIPGRQGVMPQSIHTDGLEMPPAIGLTSPAPGERRMVSASSGLPLRWTGYDSTTSLTLLVLSLAGEPLFLVGNLIDDGSFDITPAQLAPFAGQTIQVVMTRTQENFEALPTGPSLQLRGTTTFSIDVEVL